MAILNVDYADFFVFSPKGNFTERISYDDSFWKDLLINLNGFWKKFVAPEILFKNILKMNEIESLTKINRPRKIIALRQVINILSKNQ